MKRGINGSRFRAVHLVDRHQHIFLQPLDQLAADRRLGEKIVIWREHGIAAGGDFIKTSTGKVQPAATPAVTLVMLEAIRDHYYATGRRIGMKPAGGIRTAKQALHYLVMIKETLGALKDGDAWLTPDFFRFGASTLCNDLLRQIAWLKTGHYMAGYDFSEA